MKKQRRPAQLRKRAGSTERQGQSGASAGATLSRRMILNHIRNGLIVTAAVGAGGWGAAYAYTTHIERHDLSVIGNGVATVVQIHDPQCPTCRALQRETLRAAQSFEDDVLQVRVANIRTTEGRALASRYGVPHVTLLLFDGAGEMQRVLSGPNNRDFLRVQFAAHLATDLGT